MSHNGSHWKQDIKQIDANGVERLVGITCFDCDKTWWKDGRVTTP